MPSVLAKLEADFEQQPLLHLKAVAQTRWQRVSDISLCVFGAVVMVYTTTLTIMSWAGGSDAPKAPGYCD